MTGAPLRLPLVVLLAAVVPAGTAAAQSFVAQPQHYMLTTDVYDGRALWVQPAGLAKRREASIAIMATGDRVDGPLLLGQYGVTIATGGLGVGWQHDESAVSTDHIDTYAIGFGFGGPKASVGLDRRWHRGTNTKDGAWDFGGRFQPGGIFELSIAWRDVGSPVILGDTIFATLVPGLALQLFHARVQLGADWELVTSGWGTSAIRAGATVALPMGLGFHARTELNPNFDIRVLSVALSWQAAVSRITAFGAMGRSGATDHYGIWGSTVTDPNRPRRSGGRFRG